MFLCFWLIVCRFQCFVRGSSPSGKVVSREPPYPSEITAFEPHPPTSPSEFPMIFRVGEYGYFLEPHIGNYCMLNTPKTKWETSYFSCHWQHFQAVQCLLSFYPLFFFWAPLEWECIRLLFCWILQRDESSFFEQRGTHWSKTNIQTV